MKPILKIELIIIAVIHTTVPIGVQIAVKVKNYLFYFGRDIKDWKISPGF